MSAAAFSVALLDPAAPCPSGLVTWNGSDATQRFGVYRNNVTFSLVEALAETFPVVRQLVGTHFFQAIAGEFVRRSPPASPVLAWYGAMFADFVAAFPPAAGVPYLADVARLEYARVLAFHAADAVPLPTAELAACLSAPERLPGLCLQLHPSLAVIASRFAVVSLWDAHRGAGDIGAVDPGKPECALVQRRNLAVEVSVLPAAAACFVAALLSGEALGAAVDRAASLAGTDGSAPFDPVQCFHLLVSRQMLVGLGDQSQQPGEQS